MAKDILVNVFVFNAATPTPRVQETFWVLPSDFVWLELFDRYVFGELTSRIRIAWPLVPRGMNEDVTTRLIESDDLITIWPQNWSRFGSRCNRAWVNGRHLSFDKTASRESHRPIDAATLRGLVPEALPELSEADHVPAT